MPFNESFYSTTFGHTQEIPNLLAGDEVTWLYQQTMGDYSGFGDLGGSSVFANEIGLGDHWAAWHGRDGLDDLHINRLRGIGIVQDPTSGPIVIPIPGPAGSSTILQPNDRLLRLCTDPLALANHGPKLYDKCLLAGITPAGLPGPPGGGGTPQPLPPIQTPVDPVSGLPGGLIDPSTGLPVTPGGPTSTTPPATSPGTPTPGTPVAAAPGVFDQIASWVGAHIGLVVVAGIAYYIFTSKRR